MSNDLDLTRACAEFEGVLLGHGWATVAEYAPLDNDAQAFALLLAADIVENGDA